MFNFGTGLRGLRRGGVGEFAFEGWCEIAVVKVGGGACGDLERRRTSSEGVRDRLL